MDLKQYTIHFDGSSKPNPGVMVSSYIISDEEKTICSDVIKPGDGTSNMAEYIGLYNGLKTAIQLGFKHIKIIGDSELVIRQVTGAYKCNKPELMHYRDLIREQLQKFHTYEIFHVLRINNKAADALCRKEL